MKITISGYEGSGKDTQAPLLRDELRKVGHDYSLISMGDLRREAAKRRKMTIMEFNEWSTKNPDEGDRYFDNYLREYSQENDNFIAVARLGWYLIPQSIKCFFNVEPYEGAKRIYLANLESPKRNETLANSIEQQMEFNSLRVSKDKKRFCELYGIENHMDPRHFDLIFDTTHLTKQEITPIVFEKVLEKIRAY